MVRLIALASMILLSACATDRPLAFGCPRMAEFRVPVEATPAEPGAISIASDEPAPLVALIAETIGPAGVAEAGRQAPNDFLVLSGGGPWGAFGAGFLKGWSERGAGDTVRPERFNLVTGVSTGALQATYAFLGKDMDDALIGAYTIARERELVRQHGDSFFLSHASMADTAPLAGYVRARIAPLIAQVAAPEHAGRTLLVGVVDALDGRMYAIDLTRIARDLDGAERVECYTGALLASSAVPLAFRQVTIEGTPYLDGGVRQSVFVLGVQDAVAQALVRSQARGRVFVVLNGDVGVKRIAELPAKILPTLSRLKALVFNQIEQTSIYNVAAKAPGMRAYLITAQGHGCSEAKGAIFDPAFMRCLIAFGRERWSGADPWQPLDPR